VGVLFIAAEAEGSRSRRANKLGFSEAVGIGLAQAALVPGVSRSGATITLGLFFGLRREEAARFSFLMSVPIIAGAGSLQLAEVVSQGMDAWGALIFGAVSSPRRWSGTLLSSSSCGSSPTTACTPSPTTASGSPSSWWRCSSFNVYKSLTAVAGFWYFVAIMLGAVSAFGRFPGEGRASPGGAVTLLLR
jgi:hypothetical protein